MSGRLGTWIRATSIPIRQRRWLITYRAIVIISVVIIGIVIIGS